MRSTGIQTAKHANRGNMPQRAALNFALPAGSKQNGEMLSTSFSSPASANRAYFVARNLTFAQDQQPSKADMIKEVMGKYGVPTIVGDQHLFGAATFGPSTVGLLTNHIGVVGMLALGGTT